MPSASTEFSFTERTSLKARTSSRRRSPLARSRNRFEVSLASATGPVAALSCAARASFFFACCCRLFVEELPAHRIARHRHVALGADDLEEMRAPDARAEHLGAAVQIRSPDAPEALVEARRVEAADLLPVLVEALAPGVERQRVVAAQVLDVDHLEPGLLHFQDHVGEARDPAAGEDVLADEVVGLEVADVADEMDQAEAAGLQRARVRADEIGEAVPPGVLEAADRHHLVELAVDAAEAAFDGERVLQALEFDLAARRLALRAGGVVAGHLDAPAFLRVLQEAAEAAADVDHVVAGLEQHLLRHVLELVALRLLERARAVLPVGAGIEHQRIVEPEAVELRSERVVELGVVLGAHPARVGMQELVQAVYAAPQSVLYVGVPFHAHLERLL